MILFDQIKGSPILARNVVEKKTVAWAMLFRNFVARCPWCKSQNFIQDKTFKPGKNGNTSWFKCLSCEKRFNGVQLKENIVTVCDLAWVQSDPAFRGRGYAKELLEEVKKNVHRLHTQISASIPESIELCKSVGMVEYPKEDRLTWVKEGYEPVEPLTKKEE